jgi:hypothetical protein
VCVSPRSTRARQKPSVPVTTPSDITYLSDIGCVDTLSRASAADVAPDPSRRLAPLVHLISLQTQVPPCDLNGKFPDEKVGPALGEIYHSRTNRCRNRQFSPVRLVGGGNKRLPPLRKEVDFPELGVSLQPRLTVSMQLGTVTSRLCCGGQRYHCGLLTPKPRILLCASIQDRNRILWNVWNIQGRDGPGYRGFGDEPDGFSRLDLRHETLRPDGTFQSPGC